MSVEEWQEKSSASAPISTPLFTQAQTILAYFFRQEPHLSSLFTDTKHAGISRCVGNLSPGTLGSQERTSKSELMQNHA